MSSAAAITLRLTRFMSSDDPLHELAMATREGDAAAFRLLYEKTRELAFRALFRVVGHSSELEDLLQESYVQLLKALKGYRGQARVSTFLHRVCVNVALMHVRSKRRRNEELTDETPALEAGPSSDPHHAAQVQQAQALLRSALGSLSEEKATVFVYHELLGLMPEEIAELMQSNSNTVRSRLGRARAEFTARVCELTRTKAGAA